MLAFPAKHGAIIQCKAGQTNHNNRLDRYASEQWHPLPPDNKVVFEP